MKNKTNYKNLISLVLVLILLMAIAIPSSYAATNDRRRFGAMILSALQAINITMSSTLAPAQDMLDAIADPPGYVGIYEYPWEPSWDNEILDKSVIQIWPDYTEIDGVKYTDVWLSNEAAEKFRVNAFDFKTALDIASNSNGTFGSGEGYINGVPVYDLGGGVYTSQYYEIDSEGLYSQGDFNIQVRNIAPSTDYSMYTTLNQTTKSNAYGKLPVTWRVYRNNNSGSIYTGSRFADGGSNANWDGIATFTPLEFDFDWVSGTIPADQILPSDTGMMIRVPSDSPGLQTFINNNTEFINEGGVNLDFELHPELELAVDDLLDILAPIIPVVNTGDIQFTVNHDAPIPPVPDVPIIDATVPQVVQPIINEIQNQGDIISQSIPPIIESIPKIDEICNNIDTAPYHDLDTGLDHLPSFFLPFITDLRSALGIWHYVTEWLGMIGTSFAFVTGCLVGTSIMTPIYAAIAGYMCIKVYRRMTG